MFQASNEILENYKTFHAYTLVIMVACFQRMQRVFWTFALHRMLTILFSMCLILKLLFKMFRIRQVLCDLYIIDILDSS